MAIANDASSRYLLEYRRIARDILSARWKILSGILIALALVLVLAWVSPPRYQASMILAPVDRAGGVDLSSLLPQAGAPALQYLVRRIGAGSSADFEKFQQLLTSPDIAANIATHRDIMAAMFTDEWDAKTGTWHRPDTIMASARATINTLFGLPAWKAPDNRRISERLKRMVRIEPIGATSLRRIVLSFRDPEMAQTILQALYTTTDNYIREETRENTESKMIYLRSQLENIINSDHRRALTSLLMEQEQIRLLINAKGPFVAETVERASVETYPSWPNPTLALPMALVLGAAFGMMWHYVSLSPRRILGSVSKHKSRVRNDNRKSGAKDNRAA